MMYTVQEISDITTIFRRSSVGQSYLRQVLVSMPEATISACGEAIYKHIMDKPMPVKKSFQLTNRPGSDQPRGIIPTRMKLRDAVQQVNAADIESKVTVLMSVEEIMRLNIAHAVDGKSSNEEGVVLRAFFKKEPNEPVPREQIVQIYNKVLRLLTTIDPSVMLPVYNKSFFEHCLTYLENAQGLRSHEQAAMQYLAFATAPDPRTRRITKLYETEINFDCHGCLAHEDLSSAAHQKYREEWQAFKDAIIVNRQAFDKVQKLEERLSVRDRMVGELQGKVRLLEQEPVIKNKQVDTVVSAQVKNPLQHEYEQLQERLIQEQALRKRYAEVIRDERKNIQEKRTKIHALETAMQKREEVVTDQALIVREALCVMNRYRGKKVVIIGGHPSDIREVSKYLEPFGAIIAHIPEEEASRREIPKGDLVIHYTNHSSHGTEFHLQRLSMERGRDYEVFNKSKALFPAQLVVWAKQKFL
ncbi:MAG: hypothetical protein Q7R96_01750 [Nanoarchaeota archaeon]|nr:hypothetical protein [Nanoarchaeota archaeon]